jgi:uncharacterized RDD family membrane protein YckC
MLTKYPGVFDRVKAVVIDGVILILLSMLITDIFSSFSSVPSIARAVAFVVIFILYDPLLVCITGGTIGHKFIGLRVKQEANPLKNIPFSLALVRFLLKWTLGWISLLTVMGSKKRKAIHDIAVKSVVIYQN